MSDWMTEPGYEVPAERLMSVSVTAADGRSESQQVLPGDHGQISLGWLGVLLDATGGRPLAFSLPEGKRCTTVGMRVDVVGRLPGAGEKVSGRGELLHMGSDFAVSRATISASDGSGIATAVVRFVLDPDLATVRVPEPAAAPGRTWSGSPDLRAVIGAAVFEVSGDTAELTLTPEPGFGNPYGIVHGGMHLAFVDVAMSAAVSGGDRDGPSAHTLLDVALGFHRPIPVDGGAVRLAATVRQRGRRVVLAEAVVTASDGTLLTSARGTFGKMG